MQATMPEYMKVRAYLYKLIMSSDRESLQIPPENELCRLFDVSRVTVRGAIKGLVKDKFLIPRRGLGTFINPETLNRKTLQMSTIGVTKGYGNHVSNTYDTGILESIIQSGLNFEPVYLPDSGKPDTLLEIIRSSLSGIIWENSSVDSSFESYIDALSKSGIPALLVEEEKPLGANDYILSTRVQRGRVIADYMYSKGHKRVLFIHNDDSYDAHFNPSSTYGGYCQRMTELCGDEWGALENNIVSAQDFNRKLKAINSFTAVYSGNYLVPFATDELASAGISVPDDLSYLVYEESSPFFFNGLQPDFIDKKEPLKKAVFEWLSLRVSKERKKSDIFCRNIEVKPVPGETVKDLNGGKND